MVRLWRLFNPGMGAGHLPESGGVMDQAAAMMDAFAIMSETEAMLEKKNEGEGRH